MSWALDSFELFDSHFHLFDPRFPVSANQGALPPEYSLSEYLARTRPYRLRGGALVSGSFQGFDQTYLEAALPELGKGFVGITQLPNAVSDQELIRLHRLGVRGVRFNLRRGGSEEVAQLESMARRAYQGDRLWPC